MASPKVVVVGGGVGGLVTGARLARQGLDVTLLEKNHNVGGRLQSLQWNHSTEDKSYRFDTGPSLLLLPQQYIDTFTALGEDINNHVTLKRVEPAAYRVFFAGDGSLDLLYDVQAMCAQFEKVEHGSSANYLRFLATAKEALDKGTHNFIAKDFRNFLDYANIFSLLPLLRRLSPFELLGQHHNVMSSYFESPKLRALFTFQDLYVGLTPYNAPGVFSLLAATELTDGVWYSLGGFGKVRDGLLSAATKSGLKVRTDCAVRRINQSYGKVNSVDLGDGTTLKADIVVVNADLPYAYSKLLASGGSLFKSRSKAISNSKFCAGVIAFNWALSSRLRDVSHHNVFLSDDYERSWKRAATPVSLLERPNFYLHAPSRTDPLAAPKDGDAITVLLPVANLAEGYKAGDDKTMVEKARNNIFKTLRAAGVGDIEPCILHETVISPPEWERMYNLQHGAAFGISHNFFQLAYFRPDIADPHCRGLYFVGASTRPGNGVPLVLLGAKLTAARILDDYNIV